LGSSSLHRPLDSSPFQPFYPISILSLDHLNGLRRREEDKKGGGQKEQRERRDDGAEKERLK